MWNIVPDDSAFLSAIMEVSSAIPYFFKDLRACVLQISLTIHISHALDCDIGEKRYVVAEAYFDLNSLCKPS